MDIYVHADLVCVNVAVADIVVGDGEGDDVLVATSVHDVNAAAVFVINNAIGVDIHVFATVIFVAFPEVDYFVIGVVATVVVVVAAAVVVVAVAVVVDVAIVFDVHFNELFNSTENY